MAKATHTASDLLKMDSDEEAPKRTRGRPKKDAEPVEPKAAKPTFKKKAAKPSPVALKVQISETGDTKPMKTVKVSEDAIKNAVAAQVADSMFQSTSHYEPSDQQVEEQEHVAQMAAPNEENFDIFTDLGEVRAEKGNILLYEIYRNNQLVHSVEHPYSWAQILSEIASAHGGGRYKVRAKDPDQSYRYVRHQQKLIANPKKRPESQQQPQPAQVMRDSMSEAPKMDIADLSVKLMDNNRQMLREAMDMAQSSRSQSDPSTEILKTVLTSFTSMMAAKSAPPPRDDGKFELAIEKISGSFERALDKVLGQVEKLSDKIAQLEKTPTATPAMDPLTLIKMMEDAKRDGIESHREILAEAREMMEETAAARGDGAPQEPKSAWEKALEIGMGALARSAAMQAAAQPRIPRRAAAPAYAPPAVAHTSIQGAVPAVPTTQTATAAPAGARAPQGAESKPASAPAKKPFKIQLVEFLTPRLTAHISEGKSAEESAELIRGELIKRKVESRHVVKAISKEELTREAEPLGAEIVAWLAKFHDNMKEHADSTLQSPRDTANVGAGAQQAS